MRIPQVTICLTIIFSVISVHSFGQDTLFVKINNRRIPRVATKSIYLNNYVMSSDTIYETKGVKMTRENKSTLEQLQRTNYFIFLDKKDRKIVASYWTMEALYGNLKYYYRNNQIKREGGNFNGYPCGEWRYYTRKGKLRRFKKYSTCSSK